MTIKKISEDNIIQIKMVHIISFLGGLFSIFGMCAVFFYNTLKSDIETKMEKAIYEEHSNSIKREFDDTKTQLNRIEQSLIIINEDIKDILMNKNSNVTKPGVPYVAPPMN